MYALLLGSVTVLAWCSNKGDFWPGEGWPRGDRPESFSGQNIPQREGRNFSGSRMFSGERPNFPSEQTPTDGQTPPSLDQAPTDDTTTQDTVSNADTIKKLTINQNCIGCGKCAMIASSNFAMQGNKAVVISQDNTDSQSVQHTIRGCHANAISLA